MQTVAFIGALTLRVMPTPGSFGGLENWEEVIAKPANFMSAAQEDERYAS